jgi:signal transduction histidine kinase
MFQYKLDNFDVDWIKTGDHSAIFSSLTPGTYTFRVRASDDNNFDDAPEDTITFVINPPFWQTIAFYVFILILIGAGVFGFIQYRERHLLQEKIELEEKVAERTAEILKKNEEIQAQTEEIRAINESLEKRVAERTFELERKNKALEDYAFINAHNLRSPVASILGLINLIQHAQSDAEAKEIMEHMKISAERLDEVVHTITASIESSDQMDVFRNIPDTDDDDGLD